MTDTLAAADWTALGTRVRVVVTDDRQVEDARSMLANELAALDAACSRFREDSELCSLDRAEGRTIAISPLLADALAVALRAAALTDGDVDPTVGNALRALGYDRDFATLPRDGGAVHVVARAVPGWERISLDVANRRVTVPSGVRLDLGATAKAFGADRAATRIAAALGCGVLVSLGGDIAVAGEAPAGAWVVRVQDVTGHPDEEPGGPHCSVAIRTGGLATSSTTARRWTRGGALMHHIVDPRTSLPVVSPWRTVSVTAGSCVDANIATTGSIARGRTAPLWLSRLGLAARLVDGDGHVVTVGGWPEEAS